MILARAPIIIIIIMIIIHRVVDCFCPPVQNKHAHHHHRHLSASHILFMTPHILPRPIGSTTMTIIVFLIGIVSEGVKGLKGLVFQGRRGFVNGKTPQGKAPYNSAKHGTSVLIIYGTSVPRGEAWGHVRMPCRTTLTLMWPQLDL